MGIFGRKTVDMTKYNGQKAEEKKGKNSDEEYSCITFSYFPPSFNSGEEWVGGWNAKKIQAKLKGGNTIDKILCRALEEEGLEKEHYDLSPILKIKSITMGEFYNIWLNISWKPKNFYKMLEAVFNSGNIANPEWIPYNKKLQKVLNGYFEKKKIPLIGEYSHIGTNVALFGRQTNITKFFRTD